MSSMTAETATSSNRHKPPDRTGSVKLWIAVPLINFIFTLHGFWKRKSRQLDTVVNRGKRVFSDSKNRAAVILSAKPEVHKILTLTLDFVKKNKWSLVVMSSKKLADKGKHEVIGYAERKACAVLSSFPGRVVLWSVDRVCGVMETVLYFVRPDLKRAWRIQSRTGQNGGAITRERSKKNNGGLLHRLIALITKPLEIVVYTAHSIQRYLHVLAGDLSTAHVKKNGTCLSPEKQLEIQGRRKVSPRKKVKNGLINRLHGTFEYFHLANLLPGLGRKTCIDLSGQNKGELSTSPNKLDDEERKRKYEDILSESETDSEEDIENLNLENYVSDEDPDYEPQAESTDSEEYTEGDTESDIEFMPALQVHNTITLPGITKKSPIAKGFPKADKENQPDPTKVIDPVHAKEQIKTSPLKATQPSVRSPQKSGSSKSSALKCSTPKHNTGKDKPGTAATKKTPDSKHATLENGNKKTDSKNTSVANGDKKAETKASGNGSKKVSNGDKKQEKKDNDGADKVTSDGLKLQPQQRV